MPDAEDEEPSLADEKAQLKALAKHADKYGFKPAGGEPLACGRLRLAKERSFLERKTQRGAL
jgi:hypothetical protein